MDFREKIDYSALSTYMECPRKFLFQYVMHFRGGNPNINLVFGSCWHYGLEMVYKQMLIDPTISELSATEIAITSFNKLWKIEGASTWPDQDIIFPKSPGRAADVYYKYFKRYLKLDQNERSVMAVEEPFMINLSQYDSILPNYIGRIDLIFEERMKNISICDHKSSKALYPISLTSYEVSFQTDGYLSAGSLFYDRIPSMIYNIALFQKSKIDFHRYYINKRRASLDQFLQDLAYYCRRIIIDLDMLESELPTATNRNDFIQAFPRCPGSACTTFMSPCRFKEICMIRNNPLLWKDNPPQGYSINEWDPETHEAEMKRKLKEVKDG